MIHSRECKFCSKCKRAIFLEMYQIVNDVIICSLCYIQDDSLNNSVPVTRSAFVQPETYSLDSMPPPKKCDKCLDDLVLDMHCTTNGTVLCQLCSINNDIDKNRTEARVGQKRCAEKMLENSSRRYVAIGVGATVLIQIAKVDRGPMDNKNIVGKILLILI